MHGNPAQVDCQPRGQHGGHCRVSAGAAARGGLAGVMPQEHERVAGAWQAELAEWPQRVMSAHGAARAMAQALPALQVNPQRMRSNIDAVATSLPKAVVAEWFNANLVQHAARITELQLVALKS